MNDPFEWAAPANSNEEQRRLFTQLKSKMSRNRGVLCFSKTWRSPVMWSHYADRHHGFCLGFDTQDQFLHNVQYLPRRVVLDWERFELDDKYAQRSMDLFVSTKFSHWRYEKEVRKFVVLNSENFDSPHHFQVFGKDLRLKEIIVGANCDIPRKDIENAIPGQGDDIVLRKARLAFRSFNVVEQRKKSLWK